jgi:peptidoglycan/LPS O-acetylase OafA/YrhL
MAIAYRSDIDGIRALAVVPVVLFHAQIAGFGGGFVGVDVFFVISGFLITGLIQKEIAAGEFSYVSFWERRARRLLPPMALVVSISCIGAWFVLLPIELRAMGASLVAFSGFASNVYFWHKSGYFGAPAELIPLLHTWSLGVEEQFYVFFPAFLLLLAGVTASRRLASIAGLGVVSFVLGWVWVRQYPDAAYYLLPSRAWELMLGAYLALNRRDFPNLKGIYADLLLLFGMLLVLVPIFAYSKNTPFPGVAALVPCLGTGLLIWTGQRANSRLSWLFTNSPTVYIGKLSYAIYLWHWPMLTLWAAYVGKPLARLTAYEVSGIIAATLILSWLSYHLVENPVRRRQVLASRRSIFTAAAAAMSILAAVGMAAYLKDGFESRVPSSVIQIASGTNDLTSICPFVELTPTQIKSGDLCRFGAENVDDTAPRVLLWGDSHASALLPAVHGAAVQVGAVAELASRGSCPPLPDVEPGGKYGSGCPEHNAAVLSLLEHHHYDALVMGGIWSSYEKLQELRFTGDTESQAAAIDSRSLFYRQLTLVFELARKQSIPVILVGEVPYPGWGDYHPSRFAKSVWRGVDPASAGLKLGEYREREETFTSFMSSKSHEFVQFVDPSIGMCDAKGFCPAVIDNRSVYRDEHHLSTYGAGLLVPLLVKALERAAERDKAVVETR